LYGVQKADQDLETTSTGSVHNVAIGVSQSPDSLVYTPYFDSFMLLEAVILQIKKRHDPGADTTEEGGFRELRMRILSAKRSETS